MDKLIALKAQRFRHWFAGLGLIAALAALAAGAPAVAALHIPFGALAIGSLAEGIVSVHYYERGIRNG